MVFSGSSPCEGPAINSASTIASFDATDVVNLFSGSYGLILEDIDEHEFNRRMRAVSRADGLILTRWLKNKPDQQIATRLGAHIALPASLPAWIDERLSDSAAELPLLLDRLVSAMGTEHADSHAFVSDPRNLCILLDNLPSRLIYVLRRDADHNAWSDDERRLLLAMTSVSRQSVRLHKRFDRLKKVNELSYELFNSSPRGMIVLTSDGELRMVNNRARAILHEGDAISMRDERLHIADRETQKELQTIIASMDAMARDDAHHFVWHRSVARAVTSQPLQLSLRIMVLPDWHIESLPSDKMAVLLINDPYRLQEPSVEQLRDYYGLTNAQASVTVALWGGTGIIEAADKLSISVNTARTHLRAIYEKVGVKSHAELMAILTSMIVRQNDHREPHVSG